MLERLFTDNRVAYVDACAVAELDGFVAAGGGDICGCGTARDML